MDNMCWKLTSESISAEEAERFSALIRKHCGLVVPPEKSYLFETRLSKMMIDAGAENFSEFYDYILSADSASLIQKIINALVTNETFWFRDGSPWKVLNESILPRLVGELRAGKKRRVRIWCAAVSTGQEAYSTVMCVDDYLTKNQINDVGLSSFEFIATDISSKVLDIAKKGRYDAISIVRGLSDYYKKKYFAYDQAAWNLEAKIRDRVKFQRFNLQDSYTQFGLFDVIFCRYVLIYFAQENKKEILSKMSGSLADDGVLFTGNYALYDLFEENLQARHYENATYYTKKAVSE